VEQPAERGHPPAGGARPRARRGRGGRRLAAGASERERGYLAAVARLYDGDERLDQGARLAAYERAMADLVAAQPADTEARIFHAIALVAAAPPTDKGYANQRRAGAVLEALWAAQPDHPGLAHYIIHSYDVPALAPRAAAAARRYADIAPGAAHALHMPSHTFTRLGQWEASAATNRRSAAAALRDSAISEVLHASDYLVYAYLQMRRDSAARRVLDGLPALAARFDVNAVTGPRPGSAGVFALAAIPARYALERRAWAEAAALEPTPSAFPHTEAMTHFARALGAARLGRVAAGRPAVDSLAAIHERLRARGDAYWAEQAAIQRLGAGAWVALAEGGAARRWRRCARRPRARRDREERREPRPAPRRRASCSATCFWRPAARPRRSPSTGARSRGSRGGTGRSTARGGRRPRRATGRRPRATRPSWRVSPRPGGGRVALGFV
jgi:hypothetical protein